MNLVQFNEIFLSNLIIFVSDKLIVIILHDDNTTCPSGNKFLQGYVSKLLASGAQEPKDSPFESGN